jgi:hypothetical protein
LFQRLAVLLLRQVICKASMPSNISMQLSEMVLFARAASSSGRADMGERPPDERLRFKARAVVLKVGPFLRVGDGNYREVFGARDGEDAVAVLLIRGGNGKIIRSVP